MKATSIAVIFTTIFAAAACGDFVRSSGANQQNAATQNAALTAVAGFSGMQVTGITVSDTGRTFANFPRWRDGVTISVIELNADGSWSPYPNLDWNTWAGVSKENTFSCVQTVVAFGNSLFILDPSSPKLSSAPRNAIVYEFDLITNTLKNSWKFDSISAPARSHLNDLRIDGRGRIAYIADSGIGAIVILDLSTGKARRVLEQSPTTKSDAMPIYVDGKPLLVQNGRPMRIHLNSIALYNGYLYYHSRTARHLYRISTDILSNTTISQTEAAGHVEDLGPIPLTNAMTFDKMGNLFMGDLEKKAIVYRMPGGEIRTLIRDIDLHWIDLHWIDSLAINKENELIFTDSRLNVAGPGSSTIGMMFSIYKVALPL